MSPLPQVQIGSDEPLYNIGVVSRMTGISMATLRAWERRYDFPDSERTAGGHRLYSERDVMRLRWVKDRIDEGMQTAQAINALRHQEELGHFAQPERFPITRAEVSVEGADYLNVFQDRLLNSLKRHDIQDADRVMGEALTMSSPEDLILNVISPTFTEIGEAWEQGKINVTTEHLATNYLRQRLMMWMVSGPPPRTTKPIVLACAPKEWHEGSLLILGAILRRRSWPVAYLGQSVPLPDLAEYLRDINPNLVVIIAMTEGSASELIEWPQYLPEIAEKGKPIISYGGYIFSHQPEWRVRMPGIYLGDTLKDGVQNIENLLT